MIQTDDSTLQKYLSSRESMIDNNNKKGRRRKYRYRRKTKYLYHTPKKLRNKLKTTKISKQNIMAAKHHYIRCSKKIPPRIYQKYLISRVSNQQKQKNPYIRCSFKNTSPSISTILYLPRLKSTNEGKQYTDDN